MASLKKEAEGIVTKYNSDKTKGRLDAVQNSGDLNVVKYDSTESAFEISFNGTKKVRLTVHVPPDYPKESPLVFTESDSFDVCFH